MAKKIRITRKTLKEDEVRSLWFRALAWANENRKPLLMATAAVVVAILFVVGWRQRATARAASANIILSRARNEVEIALFAQSEDERQARFESAKEKLQMVLDAYGRTKLAPYAVYLLGNIAFFQNNYDDAERYFQEYIELVDDPVEKADGYIALGYTYENKFFWTPQEAEDRVWLERAEKSYLQAEDLTSGTMQHYMAMHCRARLYDLEMDQQEKAKELYARVAEERKIEPREPPGAPNRTPQEMMLRQLMQAKHLFTLAETARLRLEQLEASE